jgi:hypothetical protein
MPFYRGEIVSDAYLQSLLKAYRQAYINAGGPDYEDSDQPLLDAFSAAGIADTSGAAGMGRNQAAADKAAGQEARAQSLAPGGAIVATAPKGTPPIINTMTSGGDARAFLTLDGLPTMGGSAAPNPLAAGFMANGGSPIGNGGGLLSGGGIAGIPWLLILGIGAAAWYLMEGGK